MNQTFSLNRWGLLAGKHWSENRKKYVLSIVAIASLMILWYGFVIIINPESALQKDMQSSTYYVGLFIIGCIYASLLFTELSDKPKGINYLTVPASHLEKLLCNLLFGVIIFFVLYLLLFYAVTMPMLSLSNTVREMHWKEIYPDQSFKPETITNVFVAEGARKGANPFYYLQLGYIAVQACFVLGSVYFTRFSFIKTVISVLLVWLFFFLFMAKGLTSFMPQGNYYNGLTNWSIWDDGNTTNKVIMLPKWVDTTCSFLFKFGFAPVFWVATYFRLKEKEI